MKEIKKLADLKGYKIKEWVKRPVKVRAIEIHEKIKIHTREGTLYGEVGDFVIEGIKGEIYPCGREIFFKTYKIVE